MRQTEALKQILEKENRLETLMEEVIPPEVKEYVCSNCGVKGHNKRTCMHF